MPSAARAQALVCAVLDAPGVSDVAVKRLQRSTESALKQLSGLSVGEGPAYKRGAPRRCTDDCAQQLAASTSSAGVVVLSLEGKGERVTVELQLWLDGQRLGTRRGEGSVDGFEVAVRPVLEALLPAWARKGFGALRVDAEAGAAVKVDGRVVTVKPGELLAVTAGVHQVDVVFADGHAVLQRVEVAEGSRGRVEAASPAEVVESAARPSKGTGALRIVSYGVWMAGAATLAGGLVAGALGKGTAAGLSPCQQTTRDCAALDTVLEQNRQAQAYATTGNVLLGVGVGLLAVGVGLFVVDVASP
jgi:hypothetical protein